MVGGISPEGESILRAYVNKFYPDAKIEPLSPNGVKGRMKNHASRPDVALVIIDESLYRTCVGVADDVLRLPKVHKYVDDDGLKQFLISKFGVLDVGAEDTSPAAPVDDLVHFVGDDDVDFGMVSETEDSSDDVIKRLTDELAQEKLLVENLTMQLQESQDSGDIPELVARIRELEGALAAKEDELKTQANNAYADLGKVARADQIIGQLGELKDELKAEKEAKAALEYDKATLSGKIEDYKKEILDLEGKVAEGEEYQKRVSELEDTLVEKEKQWQAEVEGKAAEISVLQEKVTEGEGVVSELTGMKSQYEEKRLELSNLQVDYDAMQKKYEALQVSTEDLQKRIADLEGQLSQRKAEIEGYSERILVIEKLQSEIESLKSTIAELQDEVSQKDESLLGKDELIASMQEDLETLSHKDAEIAMLNERISGYTVTTDQLNQDIASMQSRIAELEGSLKTANNDLVIQQDAMQVKNDALDKIILEKKDLETQVTELTDAKAAAESKYLDAQEGIAQRDAKISTLMDEGTKLQNQVTSLQAKLTDATVEATVTKQLEEDLFAERRKSARLSSEVEVLRKGDTSPQAAELRAEVAKLKEELEKAGNSGVDSAEVEKLRVDLEAARERSVNLEMELAGQEETMRDFQSGIFYQLSNSVQGKATTGVSLMKLPQLSGKFICTAAATIESVGALYQLLNRTCSSTQKRVIIVDLATDTSVERAFGVSTNVTATSWLQGEAQVKQCILGTRMPNVKVVLVATRYLNELSLLVVDWVKRLSELQGLADCIVLNIGCLNSLVAKLLFNTFGQAMPVHAIVKATPINLRTALFCLMGLKQVGAEVDCVNFTDVEASKEVYRGLTAKYSTKILRDTDVIDI